MLIFRYFLSTSSIPSHTKAVAWLCYFLNKFVTHFNEKSLENTSTKKRKKTVENKREEFVPSSWFLCFCFLSFSYFFIVIIRKVMWMLWGKCLMLMQGRTNIESFWGLNYLITRLSFTNAIIFIILLSSRVAFHASLKSV